MQRTRWSDHSCHRYQSYTVLTTIQVAVVADVLLTPLLGLIVNGETLPLSHCDVEPIGQVLLEQSVFKKSLNTPGSSLLLIE